MSDPSSGIADRRPSRPGPPAPGPPRAELGGRAARAAGHPGRPGRLAVPPRRRGPRWPSWSAWSASAAWLGYRYVLRPLVVRFADLDIALRIEERWPGLNDRLASTSSSSSWTPRRRPLRLAGPARGDGPADARGDRARSTSARSIEPQAGRSGRLGLAAAAARVAGLAASRPPESDAGSPCGGSSSRSGATAGRSRRTCVARRAETTPQGRAGRVVHAGRGGPARASGCPASARATYRFADGETIDRVAPRRRGGRLPRPDRVGQPARSRSRSPAGDDSTSIRDVAVKVVPPPALKAPDASAWSRPPYTGLAAPDPRPGPDPGPRARGDPARARGRGQQAAGAAPRCTWASSRPGRRSPSTPAGPASRRRFTVKATSPFWFELQGHRGLPATARPSATTSAAFTDEAPAGRDRRADERPRRPGRRDRPGPDRRSTTTSASSRPGLLYKVATGDSEPHEDVAIPLWSAPDETPDAGRAARQAPGGRATTGTSPR